MFKPRPSLSGVHTRVASKESNFFSVRTETNRNSICFGCFSFCFAKPKIIFFGLFRCFGPVSKQSIQTEFSRNKPKKSPKIWGSSKPFIFFSQFKPKLNLFRLFFGLLFWETQKKFFGLFRFVLMFRTSIETTETNRTYDMGN
jgi:hypothetical protein